MLTRDLKLSKTTSPKIICIKATDCKKQLKEVIEKLNLKIAESKMVTICTVCNEFLEGILKDEVKNYSKFSKELDKTIIL